jgi:cystathionine gamma-lyase
VAHAGLPPAEQGEPFLPGPVLASPFHLAGDADSAPYGYHRNASPTAALYERALGELEDGEAVVFASGMAAVSAILLPSLEAGDVLVAPSDGYPAVRGVAQRDLAAHGVEVRLVPTEEGAIRAALPGATMLWLESPSNPNLDVVPIAALAEAAHGEGATVVVDNTLATPLGQRPLDLGADLSVTSASKHLTGHSDLILGVVVARSARRVEELRAWRTRTGAIAGPFEAWLAHRSLATLDVRLEREEAGALALAEALAARDDVTAVRYPGRPDDPAHAVAAAQMTRFGTVISFVLADAARAQRFLAACRIVTEATSFGGVHTTAERRARWGDAVPEGLVRLSAGVEDARDLVEDVLQALDAAAAGGA